METTDTERADYVLVYDPSERHCCGESSCDTSSCAEGNENWTNAGQGDAGDMSMILWSDDDNDWGFTGDMQGGTATGSDKAIETGYTAFEGEKTLTGEELWVRIIIRALKNVVQIAVHKDEISPDPGSPVPPTKIRSRGWASSDSSLNNTTLPYHDVKIPEDIEGHKFDNICGADRSIWPPSGPDATVPITVDSVRVTNSGRRTVVEWSTSNEVINAGFNIYGLSRHGWERLNGELIPSTSPALLEPQDYRYEVGGGSYERFQIADVDFQGRERRHGPFAVGELYGEKVAPRRIDWASIRSEQENRAGIREAQRQFQKSTGSKRRATSIDKGTSGIGVDFEVDRTGIYRVTYSELKAAGFDLAGIPARSLALVSRGQTVPIRVQAGMNSPAQRRSRFDKSIFGPGGFIEFYGEALDSLYTRTNLYHLVASPRRVRRIVPIRAGVPSDVSAPFYYTEIFERQQQRYYSFSSPTGDPWYDTSLFARSTPKVRSFEFDPANLATEGVSTRLQIDLWGATNWPGGDPDHHVVVELNDQVVADRWFDGSVALPLDIELPAGLVRPGRNILSIRQPADTGFDYDLVYLDGFRVSYPRQFIAQDGRLGFEGSGEAFQVRGLSSAEVVVYQMRDGTVNLLEGVAVKFEKIRKGYTATFAGTDEAARYEVWSSESLLKPAIRSSRPHTDITSGSAEYLMISHPDFLNGLGLLARARQADGLSVMAVDVEDIYAQFGAGIIDPEAIRSYIAYAVENLDTRYVLLVGGDTYDYLDHLGEGSISFIPSLYVRTHPVVAFTPSDPLLGDIDGDLIPDVPIGRFPVRTSAELSSVIRKTLDYPSASHQGTAIFVADRDESRISFTQESERMIERLPGNWSIDRVYLGDTEANIGRADLLAAWDEGRALVNFVGHSGPTSWSFDGLFRAADAETLGNRLDPSVVFQWGCWNTYHVLPAYNTMAHELLLSGRRGAALVLGASTLTDASSESQLARRLLDRLFQPGMTIGQAVQDAKADLASTQPQLLDVILGWTLLGDPAMKIQ